MPALDGGDRILTHVDAILQYLTGKYPDAEIGAGPGVYDYYELHNWLAFFTGDLDAAFCPFFNSERFAVDQGEPSVNAVEEASYTLIDKFYSFLDSRLSDRDGLLGNRRAIADFYALPMLRWGQTLPEGHTPCPTIERYYLVLSENERIQSTLSEQGIKVECKWAIRKISCVRQHSKSRSNPAIQPARSITS